MVGTDTHQRRDSSRRLEIPDSCRVQSGRFRHLSVTIIEPPLCQLFKAGTLPGDHELVDLVEDALFSSFMAYEAGGAVRSGFVS